MSSSGRTASSLETLGSVCVLTARTDSSVTARFTQCSTLASSVLPRLLYSEVSFMYARNGGTGPVLESHAASILSSAAAQASADSQAFSAPVGFSFPRRGARQEEEGLGATIASKDVGVRAS